MTLLFVFSIVFFVFIFTRFGASLAARNATVWWMMAAFVALGQLYPEAYRRVSSLFGFQMVSNFVFAAMIVFLLFFIVQLSGYVTDQSRRFRSLVARQAAASYLNSYKNKPDGLNALIVLPCFNEEAALPAIIPRLDALGISYCVVDDGSLDSSARVLRTLAPVSHTRHSANAGVSTALLTGFEIAEELGFDFVVQCDSDGQHPVELVPDLIRTASQQKTDLLIGSRFSQGGGRTTLESTSFSRRIGGIVLSWTLFVLGRGVHVTDPTSGFRVYSRRAMSFLRRHMPDEYPEPESIMLLACERMSVAEMPVRMLPRTTGISSISGLQTMLYMIKVITAILGLRLRRGFARLREAKSRKSHPLNLDAGNSH